MKKFSIYIAFSILLIYTALILSALIYFNGQDFIQIIRSARILSAIKISLLAATLATFLSFLLALPAGYALSRFQFPFKKLIDLILEIPLIISPAALGALILVFFSGKAGRWVQEHTVQVIYTFAGVVVAQFIATLGIATRFVKTTIDEIPDRFEQVARTLGANSFQVFTTILLPLAKRGLVGAFFLTWAKALGEFGATVTVAGTMAYKTETIPVAIYMQLSNANIESGIVLILLLVIIGLAVLLFTRLVLKRTTYD